MNLRHIYTLLILPTLIACTQEQTNTLDTNHNIWEDQTILQINREAPHANFIAYQTTPNDRTLSLDGQWKFRWTPIPDEQDDNFFATSYSDSHWDNIAVPGDWEMLGYGTPIYSSSGYTFFVDPPRVMGEPKKNYTAYVERNPTGCYRRTFDLPKEWTDKEVYIHLGAVSSAVYVYINGQFVGYSQGSMEPAEFRLTPYLHSGSNLVALRVLKYSDGSYLEDQDMWRLAGIHRNIYLFATEKIRIKDIGVRTELADDYKSARLTIHPEVVATGSENGQGYTLSATLFDANGQIVPHDTMKADVMTMLNKAHKAGIMNQRTPQRGYPIWGWLYADIKNPKLWSAETPNLYRLELKLADSLGNIVEKATLNIGFRSVEIANGQLLVNGVPTRLRGVNRHEMDPRSGHVVSEEGMLQDILLMKRANVNAVRTCHYPNHPRWYELCDSLGLYVLDEVDIEEHGLRGGLADDPTWAAAWLDRTQRLVIRDRNHPSVIGWSLGNEAGWGSNFALTAAWIHEYDPTRFVHYEGAQGSRELPDGTKIKCLDPSYVDVISRFYPRTQDAYLNPGVQDADMERPENARWERLLSIALDKSDNRPVLTSEYAHAMGNALGNMREYWDEIYSHPRMLGGFIWEWADEGILKPVGKPIPKGGIVNISPTDTLMMAYGGDFGDKPNLKVFCIKGIVDANRQIGSKYEEVKAVYSPVDVIWQNKPILVSKDAHANLADYVVEDIVEPYTLRHIAIVRLAHNKLWADSGYVVLRKEITPPTSKTNFGLKATNVSADKTELAKDWFTTVSPHLYRPPLDNDKGFGNWIAKDWTRNQMNALRDSVIMPLKITQSDPDKPAILSARYAYVAKSGYIEVDYAISYDIENIEVEATFTPIGDLPTLPCLGLTFTLPQGLDSVEYIGYGPTDTYPDRHEGATYNRYTASIASQYTHYPRPQDSGNHIGSNLIRVYGFGKSFTVCHDTPFSFSALPYSVSQIANATHDYELSPDGHTYLNIDCATLGIGNGSCGPGVLSKYAIAQKTHKLHLFIKKQL